MDFAFPEDEFDSISVSDMKKAEVIEAEEELLMKEKGEDLDSTVQSEFKTERRRVKLYTIEEESSEDEEDREDEEGDEKEMEEGEWMKKKRPQGLSELEKYFLLLGGETEFSQQFWLFDHELNYLFSYSEYNSDWQLAIPKTSK